MSATNPAHPRDAARHAGQARPRIHRVGPGLYRTADGMWEIVQVLGTDGWTVRPDATWPGPRRDRPKPMRVGSLDAARTAIGGVQARQATADATRRGGRDPFARIPAAPVDEGWWTA